MEYPGIERAGKTLEFKRSSIQQKARKEIAEAVDIPLAALQVEISRLQNAAAALDGQVSEAASPDVQEGKTNGGRNLINI